MTFTSSHPAEAAASGKVPGLVSDLLRATIELWWQSDTRLPLLGPAYSLSEQMVREGHLERFLEAITFELRHPPRLAAERRAAEDRVTSAAIAFARSALALDGRHLDVLFKSGFSKVTREFTLAARRFDPTISAEDIFQALRNVWTMNGLQMLLGLPVELTSAVFSYSMLYPYTDNYLDDPAIPLATKIGFSERFAHCLEGARIVPANAYEEAIGRLVGMLEHQFERSRYPQAFESLLAIHRAQTASLGLLRRDASPYEVDVLGISLEKGGTSVLADGYLVAGFLTEPQAEFIFRWGAFVQLVDDLQDVALDHGRGVLTVYSQTAKRWPLDAITNRTLSFGQKVMAGLSCFAAVEAQPIKELMNIGTTLLLLDAAGQAERFYTRQALVELESHFPFRFSVLKRHRAKMNRRRGLLMRLAEALAKLEEVDPPGGLLGF